MVKIALGRKLTALLLSFLITIAFIWFSLYPSSIIDILLKRLDYIAYDMRLNLLLSPQTRPKNLIVIVDIDEKSLKAEGRWPWTRAKLSALVKALYQQGVTVIAFDMLFPEAEDSADEEFAKILSQEKNKNVLGVFFSGRKEPPAGELPAPAVVLSQKNENISFPAMQSYIANVPVLQVAAGHAGTISVISDQDGAIRHYSLLQRYGNSLYPSLALEAMRLYLLEKNITLNTEKVGDYLTVEAVNLGNQRIATDGEGRVFIPYLGPSRTFPYYSATDVLHHRLLPQQLQNALVFVGTSAVGLSDLRSTPVESVYPGVEIHANVAEAIFANHFPYVPAWAPGAQLALLVLSGIGLSLLFVFMGPLWIILISIVSVLSFFFGSVLLWKTTAMVFPITLPIFLAAALASFNMTYGFFTESKRRDELKKVFEQYVPAARVEEIIKHPEALNIFEGERKVMSVLFMDIRSFTTISEKLTIAELKKLLNFFLTEMTGIIFKHGGTIDKYVGDMIMAFWGAPLSDEEHARHALMAGLDMINTTLQLQSRLTEMNLPNIHIGVGVNTGMMDVGDMGSTYRRAYTVLGDAVNLASRLESLTKYYGVNIICGENTVSGQDVFVFRLLDKVKVKGKHIGISIYEPLGLRAVISAEKLEELQHYEKALDAYFHQDWQSAQKIFLHLANNTADSILYQVYLNRIRQFITHPPSDEWDGVWEHLEK
jgi:adenylate cyclase